MTLCYLGLGSNLRSPVRQLRQAIKKLRQLPQSMIKKQSSVYFSQPMGVRSQPLFCNMVISMHTNLSPQALLKHCQSIEIKQQRIRKRHWGARTIDIDILLYGNVLLYQKNLIIPHKGMLHRDFVLVPLLEISSEACLPSGERLATYLHRPMVKYLK